MSTFTVHPEFEAKFSLGQSVWFINARNQVEGSTICTIEFSLVKIGTKKRLCCGGYKLNIFVFNSSTNVFLVRDLYGTEKEARKMAVWCPIKGITKSQWNTAIGYRNANARRNSELGTCSCSGLDVARSLLLQCKEAGGLIKRDVFQIAVLLRNSGHGNILDATEHPKPILKNIFSQLGVVLDSERL